MNIYVSCPHSFSEGLDKVLKYLSYYIVDSVTCNRKGESYDFSLLERADCVIFVIDSFKWQEKLENISRGMLHELVYCLNHKKSFYLAYRAADGINIYGAQITPDLVLLELREIFLRYKILNLSYRHLENCILIVLPRSFLELLK